MFIIAEIGINHGGDEAVCAAMIEAAARAGADAVKLQTVTPEASYHPDTESYAIFRDATLAIDSMMRLAGVAEQNDIVLFTTPGDPPALEMLRKLSQPAFKISSGLMTNLPLIRMAAGLGVPLIISTGMAEMSEIEAALSIARKSGARHIALLQCTSLYPASAQTLNLRAISTLETYFGVPVGYSDHYDGALACVAAVVAGARILEKHFTLDTKLPGADHAISLDPDSFAALVRDVRAVEAMMGSAEKKPDPAEVPLREGRHRRLVAARDMTKGETVTAQDLLLMRLPGDRPGLVAARYDDVIGKPLAKSVDRLEGLSPDMIEGME